jgi:uncharacterized protein (TIGR01777 family)
MRLHTFTTRSQVPAPVAETFAWHERPGAFLRLNPPGERVDVVSQTGGIGDGAEVELRMHLGPLRLRWSARHRDYRPGEQFVDEQVRGPFARWVHTHAMRAQGSESAELEDRIEYALPLGLLGDAVAGRAIEHKLSRMFSYRHAILGHDLAAHRKAALPPMQLAITGASGLIGQAFSAFLSTGGHTVRRFVRTPTAASSSELPWDPARGRLDPSTLLGQDAIVHLAGESVGARWTPARKERILRSRVDGTRLLAETIAKLPSSQRPKVLISASAVGYYGASPLGPVDEAAPPGDDFLARVCVEWEAAARPAADAGVRVVHPRFGIVLSPAGGALQKLLTPFQLGVGGRIGDGKQPMSWIALDDAVYALHHLLTRPLSGPVNLVAPRAVSNAELASTLGQVLGRPSLLPVPSLAVKLLFGEMGDVALLGGAEVLPRALEADGFTFRYPELEGALRHLLGR